MTRWSRHRQRRPDSRTRLIVGQSNNLAELIDILTPIRERKVRSAVDAMMEILAQGLKPRRTNATTEASGRTTYAI